MIRFSLLLLLICSYTASFAQECGTVVTKSQVNYMNSLFKQNFRLAEQQYVVNIPIVAHIVRQSNGTGGLSVANLQQEIARVNALYQNVEMQFVINEVRYIDSDEFYNFNASQEDALATRRDVGKVINIYFFNSITSGGGALCGYTRFPPSTDRVLMANSCSTNGTTLAHELGHYFTLYHTHGKTNTGTTDELVNGANCQTAGDEICDTPADPNLSGKVNANCEYTGTARDANGSYYTPYVNNIMSYAPQQCRASFTTQQYNRIRKGFELGRSYLAYVTEAFVADFSTDDLAQCTPGVFQFESKTLGAARYEWVFPGGTPTSSTQAKPQVTYKEPGVYDVSLKVYNNAGVSSSVTKQGYVVVEDALAGSLSSEVQEPVNELVIPEKWEIFNPDRSITFEVVNINRGDEATNSFFINNFLYRTEGLFDRDVLYAPTFDVRGAKKLTISYDYAYTYYNPNEQFRSYDTLSVVVKYDCADNYQKLFTRGGLSLATANPVGEVPFIPTDAQWKRQSVPLDLTKFNYGQYTTATFGFLNQTGHGNNLYIDNVTITPDYSLPVPTNLKAFSSNASTIALTWNFQAANAAGIIIQRAQGSPDNFVSIDTVAANSLFYNDRSFPASAASLYYRIVAYNPNFTSAATQVVEVSSPLGIDEAFEQVHKIYPNPFSQVVVIELEEKSGFAEVIIHDSVGKKLYQKQHEIQKGAISLKPTLAAGLYIVRVNVNSKSYLSRIIKN